MEVEPENVNISAIFGSIVVSVVVIVVLVAFAVALTGRGFQEAKMAATQTTGYPTLRETDFKGASKLAGYSRADDGSYTIPIERAMELEAQEAGQ